MVTFDDYLLCDASGNERDDKVDESSSDNEEMKKVLKNSKKIGRQAQ